jgi:glycosyltransferase involved in cell wall biosynthesis
LVKQEKEKINLVLFLTLGGSLKQWHNAGILDRELALYKELKEKYNVSTSIISFGDKTEKQITKNYSYIRTYYNKLNLHPRLYNNLIPIIFYKVFKKASLIKTNQFYGAHLAKRVAKLYSKKLIIRQGYDYLYHRLKENGQQSQAYRKAKEYVYKNIHSASSYIFTTKQISDFYKNEYKLNSEDINIIPNYILTENWKPFFKVRKKKKVIIFIGRLSKQKNLISLSKGLVGTNIKLLIVGDTDYDEKKKLERSLIENKVSFEFFKRTNQNQLKKIIDLADAFVLPSLYEGNPKILLEMMYHKIPIITTNVKGIKGLVTDKNCILIKKPDYRDIKKTLLSFYEINNKQKNNLIKNAYRESLNYSLKKICKKEFNLYTFLNEKL